MLALRLAVAVGLALEEEPIHQQHHVCQFAAASALLAVVLLAQAPVHQSVQSLWTWVSRASCSASCFSICSILGATARSRERSVLIPSVCPGGLV